MQIADIRKDYRKAALSDIESHSDAIAQFRQWWDEAVNSEIEEVNAMTLSTVTNNNKPSSRIVLLKGFDENGFLFFSNYQSRKGREIATNPNVSLVFFWKELERQVRIEGMAQISEAGVSDDYFRQRPRSSQVGAWASPQSEVIESRDALEASEQQFLDRFSDASIPRPPHWGGYSVTPQIIEFWQGRPGRLHDRICYKRGSEEGGWKKYRLAP